MRRIGDLGFREEGTLEADRRDIIDTLASLQIATHEMNECLASLSLRVKYPPTDTLHTIDDRAEAYAQGIIT